MNMTDAERQAAEVTAPLYFEVHGSGTPLLLIPGTPAMAGNSMNWPPSSPRVTW